MGTLHHFREKTEDLGIWIESTMDGDEFAFGTPERVSRSTPTPDQVLGSATSAEVVPLYAEK